MVRSPRLVGDGVPGSEACPVHGATGVRTLKKGLPHHVEDVRGRPCEIVRKSPQPEFDGCVDGLPFSAAAEAK